MRDEQLTHSMVGPNAKIPANLTRRGRGGRRRRFSRRPGGVHRLLCGTSPPTRAWRSSLSTICPRAPQHAGPPPPRETAMPPTRSRTESSLPNQVRDSAERRDDDLRSRTLAQTERDCGDRHRRVSSLSGGEPQSAAFAVILSGTGSDGALGIQAIAEEGGVVFAQDPASAKFDGMPRSAIATGCVDFVLPPEGIAGGSGQNRPRASRHSARDSGSLRASFRLPEGL